MTRRSFLSRVAAGAADGSRWETATGTAVDRRHEGTTLAPATDEPPPFWFSWVDFHAGTRIYTVEPTEGGD